MKVPRSAIMQLMDAVIANGFQKATRILDKKTKVTLTAKKKIKGSYLLTIGSPNYAERLYIKAHGIPVGMLTKG
jgi:hypothetical protein